ncbi:terminase small subunit [Akkermansiaceae bacterium]|nr:terminase small subunit [Akkermansiaceae bacterium]MDB4377495.1 terminase small subunit [Akkermansiaceae bacterium]
MANKKGKRYTAAEKAEVLNWVNDYNVTHGRGGVANASKKFEITQLTIHNWVRQGGAVMSLGGGSRVAPNHSGVLRQLADLLDQISERETELNKLRKEYDALRKKL